MPRAGHHGMGHLQAVALVVFAFLVGLALGVVLGRRNPKPETVAAAGAAVAPLPAPAARRTKASRRASKAGLTDESFTPSDDILERLRKAAEGELDPAELEKTESPPPTPAQLAADAERAERERRVLERLRQQQAQPSDLPNDRDHDDAR